MSKPTITYRAYLNLYLTTNTGLPLVTDACIMSQDAGNTAGYRQDAMWCTVLSASSENSFAEAEATLQARMHVDPRFQWARAFFPDTVEKKLARYEAMKSVPHIANAVTSICKATGILED